MSQLIIENFKQDLSKNGITWEPLSLENQTYDFFFPDKRLCLFVVDETLYNEKTVNKKHFLNLKEKFKQDNINLICVYSSQMKNKYDIFLNRLLYKLGIGITNVNARDCEVKEISFQECKEFLNKHHSMGNLTAKIRLGVYDQNNVLLAATTWNVPRYNSKYQYELGRYAVKFGYNVRGNFSKLLKYFLEKHDADSILTYHDNLLGDNTVYEQNGFKKLEDSGQGFFWFKDECLFNRRSLWKGLLPKKLPDFVPTLSAHNNLRNNGYAKVWDLGQSRYEWNKNEQSQ